MNFGQNARILIHDTDHSAYLKTYDLEEAFDELDTTAFLKTAQEVIAGPDRSKISLGGLYDAATNDAELAAMLAAATTRPITIGMDGVAIGKRIRSALAQGFTHKIGASAGQLHVVTFGITPAEDGIDHGFALHDVATAESASTNSASHNNLAGTTNGGVGVLHVVANSRDGSVTIKIQQSSDNGGADPWSDLITFTAVGAGVKTSERIEVTGTVEQYLRAISTFGGTTGSLTYAVTFARR
jgi:hypothetical protein